MVLRLLIPLIVMAPAGAQEAPDLLLKLESRIQRIIDASTTHLLASDQFRFQVEEEQLAASPSGRRLIVLSSRFAYAFYDEATMKIEFIRISARTETRDPDHPLPEAELLAIADRVVAAAGITEPKKLVGIKVVVPGSPDQARETEFTFDRLYQGIPIPTPIVVALEQTTGRLTFFRPGGIWIPPLDVRPRLSLAQAKALSDMALIASTDVGGVEVVKPTELRIRPLSFYLSVKYPLPSNGPVPGRLMYCTQYRVPGYRLEGRYMSTELFDVYVDAITGEILAVTPPRSITSVPTKPSAAFDWRPLAGKGELVRNKKQVAVSGLGFQPVSGQPAKDGVRLLLKVGKTLTGLTFDARTGLVGVVHYGRVALAKPNEATRKALQRLTAAKA